MAPRIGIILQARMGSSRLPGKVLMDIGPRPLLAHIFLRLRSLHDQAETVLATSTKPADDAIVAYCAENDVPCFRGSEENVLERYYLCARENRFDHIVRLTGDNPFVDVEELSRLILLHLDTGSDCSHSYSSLPVGVGAEILTFAALERSMGSATLPHHFEHVDEYILENPSLFKIARLSVPSSKNRPDIRLTIDTPEDHALACRVVARASEDPVGTEEAIRLVDSDRAAGSE